MAFKMKGFPMHEGVEHKKKKNIFSRAKDKFWDVMEKGDEFVENLGDKYNESKVGKFMAKLDDKISGD